MSKLLEKRGVWVFLLAVVLLLAAQTYFEFQASRHRNRADSARVETFDVQGVDAVRIERVDLAKRQNSRYRQLIVNIQEPGTKASARFDGNNYDLKPRVDDGVLVLTFDMPDAHADQRRHWRSSAEDVVFLPSSIRHLEFRGVGALQMQSETSTELVALDVRMMDCYASASFDRIVVRKMSVTKRCLQPQPKNAYGEIQLDGVKAGVLEIASMFGSISLSRELSAGTLQFNVNDAVTVRAPAALLRGARFGPAPIP